MAYPKFFMSTAQFIFIFVMLADIKILLLRKEKARIGMSKKERLMLDVLQYIFLICFYFFLVWITK